MNHLTRGFRAAAFALTLLLGGTILPAATDADADRSELDVELVETATVLARPLVRATGAVTILDREQIQAMDVRSVGELLRFAPGVEVTTTGPRGGLATAQIRGGDPNFTTVLLDGVPLNDVTDVVGGSFNLNSLSVAHVERIEIVRGPLSTFLGSTGLGGVINIVTRKPEAGSSGYEVEAAAGSDAIVQAAASVHDGGERVDYFLGATWDQEEDRVAADEFVQASVVGNATVRFDSTGQLRITGRLASWETDDYPEGSGGPTFGDGRTRDSVHDEISLGLGWDFRRGGLDHRVQARLYRHELERRSPGVPGGVFFPVPPSLENTVLQRWQLGWAVQGVSFGPTRWTFGLETDVEDGENDSRYLFPAFQGGLTDGSYRLHRITGGAYAEMTAETGALLWEIGVRFDLPERSSAEWSPRVGVSYVLPSGSTRLRGSVGRAFKLPSFFALVSPPALGGNPDLAPETVIGADVAAEHVFEAVDVTASLTLFYNRFEDLIDFDFATFRNVNVPGLVEARGAELSAAWQPRDDFTIRASVTRQEVDASEGPEPLRLRPEWVGSLSGHVRIRERTGLELDGQWVSERYDEQIPTGGRNVGGYALFGAALSYDVARAWQLRARVDNLADKDYQAQLGYPGPGRTFVAGLRYRR